MGQFKIKTDKIQEMISKSVKGAGNNKILPITCRIEIDFKDNTLTLRTTDRVNYLEISTNGIEGENFNLVVDIDKLAKLIMKTTTEYMQFVYENGIFTVIGNAGNCSLFIINNAVAYGDSSVIVACSFCRDGMDSNLQCRLFTIRRYCKISAFC